MDILETVSPLLLACQLCNLWHWRLDKASWLLQRSRWLELYGWLILTLSSAISIYDLVVDRRVADVDGGTSKIGHTVDCIQLVGIRLAHATALLEALWQRRTQHLFFAQVREIDKEFAKALHVDVANTELRRTMGRNAKWMLASYMISQSFLLATKLATPGGKFAIYWLCYLLPLLVCGLRYFQIFASIHIVRHRLKLLLKLLDTLHHGGVTRPEPYVCLNNAKEEHDMPEAAVASLKLLLAAKAQYQRIWLLVVLLNRCYGLSILVNLGNDFLAITSNCYWIFLNFHQFTASTSGFLQIVGSTLWAIPHFGNVLALALMCERTSIFTTRLALSLHCNALDLDSETRNALVTQFSLQLLHQRLCISAVGFFNVDCTLLYTVVGASTTYLIILIQFHMSETSLSGESRG